MKKLRAELHCHSTYSTVDGVLTPEKIITVAKKNKIDIIALTDHNEIKGAQELKRIAPAWLNVIVGEEITTKQGDIIGLFLKEKVAVRSIVFGDISGEEVVIGEHRGVVKIEK